MVGMEFSHVGLGYVMPWHIVAIAIGDVPVALSFWSFGRISMEMRPRHGAALVRVLPIFVCRGLFFVWLW